MENSGAHKMDCELPEIGGSSVASEVSRFVRYGLVAVGGYMIGQGWLEQDTVDMIVAVGTTATPIIIGTIIGRMNRKKLVQAVKVAKGNANSEA